MSTEYEDLLEQMLEERKAKLEEVKREKARASEKATLNLVAEINFIEVELQRYRQGVSIFRTKNLPKVGRWGKPETEGHATETR